MDPDTTSSTVDKGGSQQPEEPVSSTTDNHVTTDQGYDRESYITYGENEGEGVRNFFLSLAVAV